MGCFTKSASLIVLLIAVFFGALFSGLLKQAGLFRFLDTMEQARGMQLKGMAPAMHEGTPWGFTLENMPDLTGQTMLVTGGNIGLGYWTAHHLAAAGAEVIIGCRSADKCAETAASIKAATGKSVEPALLDLGSFTSIRACAAALKETHPRLDSLILNAGVMASTHKQSPQLVLVCGHIAERLLVPGSAVRNHRGGPGDTDRCQSLRPLPPDRPPP